MKVILERSKGSPSQFKVANNKLIQLDREGKSISGALAAMYELKK